MLHLPNNCQCSEPSVYPTTWKKSGSIEKDWYIWFRFYDPNFKEQYPKGYLKIVKNMNRFKTYTERKQAVVVGLEVLQRELEAGYNPILKKRVSDKNSDYIIDPQTEFVAALEEAAKRLRLSPQAKQPMRSVIKYTMAAVKSLRMVIAIKDVRRKHIRMVIDEMERKRGKPLTDSMYNEYRARWMMLFKELVDVEATEINPIKDLKKRKVISAKKELLTPEEREAVNYHLYKNNYTFWRVVNMFFHSGARTPEFMGVKKEDVDLQAQTVRYTILKGGKRVVKRPIKDIVLPLWAELVNEAKDGEYLFGRGLKPAKVAIRPDQLEHRWRLWVQLPPKSVANPQGKGLGIKKTWYSLKHLNTDEMTEYAGAALAAKLNEHSEAVALKHYAVNEKARADVIIKSARNSFGGSK